MSATTVTRVPVSTFAEIKSVAALQGRSPAALIADAWREYLANHAAEFAEDFERAAEAIRSGDQEALRAHASRFARGAGRSGRRGAERSGSDPRCRNWLTGSSVGCRVRLVPHVPTADLCLRGSYLGPPYELRVTERCRAEDLGVNASGHFSDLLHIQIVKGFVSKRFDHPDDVRQVSPLTSGATIYRLSQGERERGATWHDEANGVVWLCACRFHTSGAADDAFPYFKELDRNGRLLPTVKDLTVLFEDSNT